MLSAPTAGGPGGPGGQLAPGAVAVPGQIGLLQQQQPSIGQQPLDLPSKLTVKCVSSFSLARVDAIMKYCS